MYPDRFRLPFIARVLMASAERQRPGLGPWTPDARARLLTVFKSELAELRSRFFEVFEDPPYWDRLEKAILDVCFPRYCAAAEKQTTLQLRDYGLWRGGDLLARSVYAVAGFAIGLFMVKMPFVPIPETWDLFAFATMIAGPFVPDFQIWVHDRKYRRQLTQIVDDLREAEDQNRLYSPLTLEPESRSALASTLPSEPTAVEPARDATNKTRERN